MTKYKFISWNIDSLNAALTGNSDRAALSMAVVDKIASEKPDVLAIQETKLSDDDKKVKKIYDILVEKFPEYAIVHRISTPPARKGYSGTMMLWKKELGDPVVTFPEIDAPAPMDQEGRMITLEFPAFYVTTVYTPNAQEGLARLDLRGEWDDQYRAYLQTLDQEKPVFACGDFNVAVAEIDLSNPKGNHNTAGFSDQEREKFQALLSAGFTDSFRKIHGQIEKNFASGQSIYTWFAQRARTSKTNNSGWRIDYWLTSNRVAEKISKSEPIETGARLDHLPILLEFDL